MQPPPDETCRLFAAEAILRKIEALRQEIDGVRAAKDIEYVHRMRVASRRLRSALTVFADCLDARQSARWLRGVRRITKALGQARDCDVQAAMLKEFLAALDAREARTGIRRLILRLHQQRDRRQRDICKALDRLQHERLLEDMDAYLNRLCAHDRLGHVPAVSPALLKLAGEAIVRHIEEVLSCQDHLADPKRIEEHHAMRIAAKRLRYTMELFEPVYGQEIQEPLAVAKKCQTALGDIHDCDVWIRALPQFLRDETERAREYFGHCRPIKRLSIGIKMLQANRRKTRADLHRHFVMYWNEVKDRGLWGKLAEMLKNRIAEANCPPPADPPPATLEKLA